MISSPSPLFVIRSLLTLFLLFFINVLDNLTDVWFKRLQSNGYYPIERYTWDSLEKRWIRFVQKYNTEMGKYWYCTTSGYTLDGFKYMVTNNAGILSDTEMCNTYKYNNE